VSADRSRYLDDCLASLAEPGAPAEVLLVPYGPEPVTLTAPDREGPAYRVLGQVATLDAARAAGLGAARGAALGLLAPTDTALPGYAERAVDALGDRALRWTPSRHGGGPLARVAAAPPRPSDAVLATEVVRRTGWPAEAGLDDAGLLALARLDAAHADPSGPSGSSDSSAVPWARWEQRDHGLGFGFEPDLVAELDPWLRTAHAAWEVVAATPVRRPWAVRLLAGLDRFLARVEEFDPDQWR